MAKPATREQHKQWALRKLGQPVIKVNVDDEQLEDRIDESLSFYRDYHFDGTEHTYLKHVVTQTDKDNGYLPISDNVQGIIRVFDIGNGISSSNLFNVRYQFHLNDLWDFSATSFAPYVTAMRHIETIEEIFVGKKPIRYNRHMDRLYIDMDWVTDILVGQYIVIEAYTIVDPDTYTDVWDDPWLKKYTTALFKEQWGQNLSKFGNVQLPGGNILDGVRILTEAQGELESLRNEMILNYSLPVADLMG